MFMDSLLEFYQSLIDYAILIGLVSALIIAFGLQLRKEKVEWVGTKKVVTQPHIIKEIIGITIGAIGIIIFFLNILLFVVSMLYAWIVLI